MYMRPPLDIVYDLSLSLLNLVCLKYVFFHFRLLQTVENIADPGVCSSTERCILSTLYDLYVTCDHLKVCVCIQRMPK